MIRFVVAAIWICAVTLGSIFFAFSARDTGETEAAPPPFFGGLDYVKADIVSVPVVRAGAIDGYILAKFVFTVDPARAAAMSVPAASILADEAYSYIYGNPVIDFAKIDKVDIDGLRVALRDSINSRIGEKVVYEVLVEQLDFLSKQEIRDNTTRRRPSEGQKPAAAVEAPAKPAH